MLSWEYPPVMVGGLGRHVFALATHLAAAGHQVTVVTRHAPKAPLEEYAHGVRIVRAMEDPPLFPLTTPNLLPWTMAFNHAMTRAGLRAAETQQYDVIHAHDWLVTHASVTLAEHLNIPLVATIHGTEAGRHQGWLPREMNKCIHSVEYWLAQEARRVIVCSQYMKWEITKLLELPGSRIAVVPNGVDQKQWRVPAKAVTAARTRFAGEGPLLAYAGRLVYEKGVQDIITAMPVLRHRHPGLRLVIAGDGPYRAELQEQVRANTLTRAVSFTGFLREELAAVLAAADILVVPSIYEPFGMVALEGACVGVPLAVSSTGGLNEIVESGVTGVTFPAKNPSALADGVSTLLSDEVEAKRMAERAGRMVRDRFCWDSVASMTAEVYRGAVRDERTRGFDMDQARAMLADRPAIVIPAGNLFEEVSA